MLLRINGEKVEYTLERESRLADVVTAVEDWLGRSGYIITGIREGGRDLLDSPRDRWSALPLENVAELDFQVGHAEDVRVEHWVTARALLAAVLGSAVLDDNGKPLWSTGKGHPDVCYVADVDPARPGLGSNTAMAPLYMNPSPSVTTPEGWPRV